MNSREIKTLRRQVSRDLHNRTTKLNKWIMDMLKESKEPYGLIGWRGNFWSSHSKDIAIMNLDDIKRILDGNFPNQLAYYGKDKGVIVCEYCKEQFKGLFALQRHDNHIQKKHKRQNWEHSLLILGVTFGVLNQLLSMFKPKKRPWLKRLFKGTNPNTSNKE